MRTDPAGYAEQRLLDDYQAGTDNGAYTDLKFRNAVEALEFDPSLMRTARKYAAYLASNNVFSHYADGKSPSERAEIEGYTAGVGENLAANSRMGFNGDLNPQEAAQGFIEQLVIDEGVASLGHRNNLLNGIYKTLGIGFAHDPTATYENYTVQNFGTE